MTDILDYYDPRGVAIGAYDVLHRVAAPMLKGDVEYYASLAGQAPKAILEVGAGTGRIALPLAERGHQVVGFDLSPAMLALAEAKRRNAAPEVQARLRFQQGDMLGLALGRRFDLVAATFYTLNHVAPAAVPTALGRFRDHVAPGGRLVLHCLGERMLDVAEQAAGGEVRVQVVAQALRLSVKTVSRQVSPEARTNETILQYRLTDLSDAVLREATMRLFYHVHARDQLEQAAAAAGFAIEDRLSAFPGNDGATELILVARPV